jgi:hypothetical protein
MKMQEKREREGYKTTMKANKRRSYKKNRKSAKGAVTKKEKGLGVYQQRLCTNAITKKKKTPRESTRADK